MRAAIRISLVVFIVALVGVQFVRPARTNPSFDPAASLLRKTPPNVTAILDRSCRDCHSNDTRWPWYTNFSPFSWMVVSHVNQGRENFNYAEWTTYDEDDQDKYLGAMCDLVKKRRMPLPSYLLIHRDAKLSGAEIITLCTWADKMRDTLQ
jgi:hypothetical protein